MPKPPQWGVFYSPSCVISYNPLVKPIMNYWTLMAKMIMNVGAFEREKNSISLPDLIP